MLISCRLNRFTLRLFLVSLSAVLILTPLMFALTSVSRAAHPITLATPFGNNLLTAHNVGMTVGPLLLNSIAASPSTVSVGGPLAVTWNIPSNQSQTDWVGLYRSGAPDTAGRELWWRYTGGSLTGSFTLNAPLVAGQYEFRLLLNNSFSHVATSNSVTVSPTPTPTPTPTPVPSYSIAASPSAVSVGGPLAVTWNIPSNQSQTDWVGLYRVGAPHIAGNELWWRYTAGSPTGSFTLNAPLVAGQYEFRLSLNNSYSIVATSNSVTVSSTPTPTPMPTPTPLPTPLPTPDGAQFYVSPTGSSGGDGSIGNPWGLNALETYGVVPNGSTVNLRGGTFGLDFIPNPTDGSDPTGAVSADQTTFWMSGNPTAPIIVRPYPGERPIFNIDYLLNFNGSYVQWHEIEIRDSKTLRTSNGGWGWPRPGQVQTNGEYVKFINCVFRELNGVTNYRGALGSEFHGCLFYYIGSVDRSIAPPGGARGTGNYIQNESDVERKITNNIFFSNQVNDVQAYGSDAATVTNLTFEGNTFFNIGKLFAGSTGQSVVVWTGEIPVQNIKFNDNYLYTPTNDRQHLFFRGASNAVNVNLEMKNNRVAGGSEAVITGQWEPWVFTGNKIGNRYKMITAWVNPLPTNPSRHTWDYNTYNFLSIEGETRIPFTLNDVAYEFAAWKTATGFDANSTYTAARPTGMEVYVRPNAYAQGRANITIYNWNLAATAAVNLSTSGLVNGQTYQIKDVQNFFGPSIYSGVYSSTSPIVTITLPGTGSPVTPWVGANNAGNNGYMIPPVHTSNEFNAFVLLPR